MRKKIQIDIQKELSQLMVAYDQLHKDEAHKAHAMHSVSQFYKRLRALGSIPNNVKNKECYSSWSNTSSVLPVPTDFALFDYAIKFFNLLAKLQKSGALDQDVWVDKQSINKLKATVKNCVHPDSGMVRSEPGKRISGNDVFLGNVFDIPPLTINQLKVLAKRGKTPKDNWIQWAVQIHQLQDILKRNIDQIKMLLHPIVMAEVKDSSINTRFVDKLFENSR